MAKARISRSTKDIVQDSVLATLMDLEKLRRLALVIYGRPMTGKTLLSVYEAARLAKLYGGGVMVYSSEPNYESPQLQEAIQSIFRALSVPYELKYVEYADHLAADIYRLKKEAEEEKQSQGSEWVPKYRVLVIDSLGSLAASEEVFLSWRARSSSRAKSSSIVPKLSNVVFIASKFAKAVDGWAIVIAAASSMVGTGLYKGLVEYKPSFSEKVLHYASTLVWLGTAEDFPQNVKQKIKRMNEPLKDAKIAVVVMDRSGGTGRGVVFKFAQATENGVAYPKPVPLFTVHYQPEEDLE